MANMNDIAKELNIKTKDVISFLNGKGFDDIKGSSKNLTAEQEGLVRKEFVSGGKSASKTTSDGTVKAVKSENGTAKPSAEAKAPTESTVKTAKPAEGAARPVKKAVRPSGAEGTAEAGKMRPKKKASV